MKKFIVLLCLHIILFSLFGQVNQIYPINNSVITKSFLHFNWDGNTNQSYYIEIYNDSTATSLLFSDTVATVSYTPSIPINNGVYFWRVKESNVLTTWSSLKKFILFDINQIDNKLLWLKPDSCITNNNNKVLSWCDSSGNNNNATQTNTLKQPNLIINRLNGFNSIELDGYDDLLTFGSLNTIRDIFIVCKHLNHTEPYDPILGATSTYDFHSGTTGKILSNVNANANLRNGILKYNSEIKNINTFLRPLNFACISMYPTGNVSASNISIDRGIVGRSWDGEFVEVLLFDTALTDSTRSLIEEYLKWKYTPPLYLGKDTNICGPQIKIGCKSDNDYSSIYWSTGDTDTDSVTITQNGTYWVTVNSFGKILKDTIVISGITPSPIISLTHDTVLCYGDSLVVNYTPVAGFNYIWSTGETSNQISVKDSSTFVQLTHTDTNNCSVSSDIFFVKVDSLSLLSTIGNDRNICDGGQIYATSTGEGPFTYLWNTGDTTAFTTPPILGNQDISIEMSNFNNCYFRDTISVNALNLPAPNVAFEYDTACPNKVSQFTDLSTPGGTDNIIDWNWKFINNDTSDAQNPSYTFPEGTFNVSLTVETDSGCVNTLIKPYKSYRQPHARINSLITCAEISSLLSNSSTIAIPDVINNYNWTIGTQNYTGSSPSATFPTDGLQDVTLIVASNHGCTDTITKTIEVYPALLPDFEIDNSCIGDSTTFTDITPSFSTISRLWNFGGGQFSTDTMPTILFADTGTYSVTLQVENAIGCQNSITKTVKINPLPIANATIDNICENSLSLFYNTSNATTNNFEWLINNVPHTSDSVLLNFNSAGNYPVYHKITDINGCEDDTAFSFTIRPNPNVAFNFNPTFGQAPLLVNFENETDSAILNTWNFGENNQQSNDVNPSYTYTENGVYNVTLIAENQYGCRDSMLKIINVSPTELDVELSNLDYQTITLANGDMAYVPQLTLSNIGTRTIYNLDIYVSIDEEKNISEHWQGTLNVGESMQYIFQSYFIIPDEANINYMCAEAKNTNDDTEDLLSNNKSCTILNGKLKTSKIYPNPTNNNANIDIISKNKGNINVGVYDMAGKKVYTAENIAIQKGYNQLVIDCVHLQIGKYIVNITHQGDIYQLTFWVNH